MKQPGTRQGMRLSELVGRWTAIRPEATAILGNDAASVSYAALSVQMRLAVDWLRVREVGPRDRVAIALPDGPAAAVVGLSIASAAVSAPVSPRLTGEELAAHLRRTAAKGLVVAADADPGMVAVARASGLPVWRLPPSRGGAVEPFGTAPAECPIDAGAGAADLVRVDDVGDDAALLLYTSGTTGAPKGVALTHRNLTVSAADIAAGLELTPADRCICTMPLFHVHGFVGTVLATIASGGSVVVTGDPSADGFFDAVARHQPTWFTAVPTIHQGILARGERYRTVAPAHRFRFIRSSSAALPVATAAALEALTGAPVVEAYGMTEASHQITSNPLPPGVRKPGSVGLPDATQVRIVDDDGRPAPCGTAGHIAIRGAAVTGGYVDRPDATAESFREGWFMTGDLGRFDDDGYLFIAGRTKDVVNRGGKKIMPREIDEALMALAGVAQAVAFGVPHPTLGEDLVAAIVPLPGHALEPTALRLRLFERLSAEKVPSRLLQVDAIPVGPTGKIRRADLADAFADRLSAESAAGAPPADSLEAMIAAAFADVLRIPPPCRQANFFALGGDSLSGARVLSRVGEQLGTVLVPALLFRWPTAAGLAAALRPAAGGGAASDGAADAAIEASLLAEIDTLTDEEVAQLLAEERALATAAQSPLEPR